MNLKHEKILVFDFETTGLSPLQHKVVEMGAILLKKVDGEYVVDQKLNHLIKQEEPLSDFISNLTGITDQMLALEGVTENYAFNELYNLIDDDTLLVAYNLPFDMGFLLSLFQRYVSRNYMFTNDILDCMAVYKDRYPFPHRLESAVSQFNVVNENAHRASDDAFVTFQVLDLLGKEQNNLDLYVNVLGFNPKYKSPDTHYYKKNIKKVPQGMRGLREIEKSQTTK